MEYDKHGVDAKHDATISAGSNGEWKVDSCTSETLSDTDAYGLIRVNKFLRRKKKKKKTEKEKKKKNKHDAGDDDDDDEDDLVKVDFDRLIIYQN